MRAATKSGPATLNLGESGDFTLDVQNVGNMDAWNATIADVLPDSPTGGMCDMVPTVLDLLGLPAAQGLQGVSLRARGGHIHIAPQAVLIVSTRPTPM